MPQSCSIVSALKEFIPPFEKKEVAIDYHSIRYINLLSSYCATYDAWLLCRTAKNAVQTKKKINILNWVIRDNLFFLDVKIKYFTHSGHYCKDHLPETRCRLSSKISKSLWAQFASALIGFWEDFQLVCFFGPQKKVLLQELPTVFKHLYCSQIVTTAFTAVRRPLFSQWTHLIWKNNYQFLTLCKGQCNNSG